MTNRRSLKSIALVLASLSLLAMAGCGPKPINFAGTDRAAGVDGTIKLKKLGPDTLMVTSEFKFLPPPARVAEGATVYVLWFIPDGQTANKAGTLVYDEGSRRGSLQASTPHSRFNVILTAEKASNVVQPSEFVVARKAINASQTK